MPDKPKNDPVFGEDETIAGKSQYTSHDHETITCCLILTKDCNYDLEFDELELPVDQKVKHLNLGLRTEYWFLQ